MNRGTQDYSVRSRCGKGRRALTLAECLVVVATIGVLSAILFPVMKQASVAAIKSNATNVSRITLAAIHYGDDYDERIPIIANGAFRNLKNTRDGILTAYGNQRTDLWPLLILPYAKDRSTYTDPTRLDKYKIWDGPALSSSDPGYDPYGATYRNQNRFPFIGMNYLFLSPFLIPASKMSDATPTDFMEGEVHRFFQADEPDKTVFFLPSAEGRVPASATDTIGVQENGRGFMGVNAPGLWPVLSASTVPYTAQWNPTDCSADWCGGDIDPATSGVQTSQNFFYEDSAAGGNNVSFLDGHVKFAKTVDLAAGTDYLTATPNDGGTPSNRNHGIKAGGAHITDKTKYIWNLDDNYYGA